MTGELKNVQLSGIFWFAPDLEWLKDHSKTRSNSSGFQMLPEFSQVWSDIQIPTVVDIDTTHQKTSKNWKYVMSFQMMSDLYFSARRLAHKINCS
jgi:hypothetical protein